MIDEELYRKAADELDSDIRRPHIWARACALANDDHDEARYLYTNLRVEELLSEQARETETVATAATSSLPAANDVLELEPVEFPPLRDGDEQAVASARAGVDASSSPLTSTLDDSPDDGLIRPRSEHDRVKLELDENDTLDLDPVDVERMNDAAFGAVSPIHGGTSATPTDVRPLDGVAHVGKASDSDSLSSTSELSTAGHDTPDDDYLADAGADVELLADAGADVELLADAGADDEAHTSDVPTLFREIDVVDDESATGSLDDLGWLDEEYQAERRNLDTAVPLADDDLSDTFTRELERQAENLPGGSGSGVIPHDDYSSYDNPTQAAIREDDVEAGSAGESREELPPETDSVNTGSVDTATFGADYHGTSVLAAAGGSGVQAASNGALATDERAIDTNGDPDADVQPHNANAPLELADRRGRTEYAVYERPDTVRRAVRQGGSWVAMLCTLPWLLIRGLFGTAIVYTLLAVVVTGGLVITGLAWIDAGDSAKLATRAATIGFGMLAFVGLLVVPFARANTWREDKLERRGFELVAYVRARSPGRAIAVLERFADGTNELSR